MDWLDKIHDPYCRNCSHAKVFGRNRSGHELVRCARGYFEDKLMAVILRAGGPWRRCGEFEYSHEFPEREANVKQQV